MLTLWKRGYGATVHGPHLSPRLRLGLGGILRSWLHSPERKRRVWAAPIPKAIGTREWLRYGFSAMVILLGVAAPRVATAAARPAAGQPTARDSRAMVTRVLKQLQRRGQTLHNFSAAVRVTMYHPRTDETDMDIGRIWYEQKAGRVRFDIRFNVLVVDGAIASRHADHDIIFDGRWLIDRNGRSKVFRETRLAEPGQPFNPLKLGQGPIPIPIGQDPREVRREFIVSLPPARPVAAAGRAVPRPKPTSARLIHLRLTPRHRNMFTFARLDFWINTALKLPVKIVRLNPDGAPTTVTLIRIQINHPLHHVFPVHPPLPDSGWTVEIHSALPK